MIRTYKYRLYPNKSQQNIIQRNVDACRFVYNWALEQRKIGYKSRSKSLSWYDQCKKLPSLREEHPWQKGAYSQSLQHAIRRVDLALRFFYRNHRLGRKSGFPRFKSRRRPVQSFDIPQFFRIEFSRKRVRLPKIGRVKAVFHRKFSGTAKRVVVSFTKTGKFFISIDVDVGKAPPNKTLPSEDNTIGLDLGLTHFATLSTGEKIENPRFLIRFLKRLAVLQRRLSRRKKNGKNREKAQRQLALLHERIRNQRRDFQHKLSSRLMCENQGISLESLNTSGMLRHPRLARSISDTGWSTFVSMVRYKCEWYGRTLMRVGQFVPTSKMCCICNHEESSLALSDREWQCSKCGAYHDRDINAAINIKKIGLESIAPQELGEEPVDLLALAEGLKQETTDFSRR